MQFDYSAVLLPLVFWGCLYVAPFPRSVKVVFGVIVVLLGFVGYASAQALPATALGSQHPLSLGGNVYTFGGAQATAANAATFSYAPTATGAVATSNVSHLPGIGGGSTVPVAVNGSAAKPAVAAAIGRFALKAVGVIGVLQAGVALYDLAKELGFNLDNSGGSVVVTKPDPEVCSVAPCFDYILSNAAFTSHGSPATSCRSFMEHFGSVYVSANATYCYYKSTPTGGTFTQRWSVVNSISPVANATTPSTLAALNDAIAAKNDWASSSALGRVFRDALNSGESVAVDPVNVTGPASVPAGRTITNNGTTTTTTQVTNNYSYAGNTVSVTNVTASSTVNNTTGAVEGGSTTVEEPVATPEPEPEKDTCGMPDTPACKIDEEGTPSENPITDAKVTEGTNAVKSAQDSLRDKVVGDADKSWSWTLLGAPPIAECESVQFPVVFGVTPPAMNPCGSVDGIRAVMAWIWAFAGFGLCIGLVREVI